MRAISLWQPWAELVARELKQYETRHWTCQLGPVAIHAAKRPYSDKEMVEKAHACRIQMLQDEVDPFTLKFGVVLCVAEIVACVKVDAVRDQLDKRELAYGNYDNTCPDCKGLGCNGCDTKGRIQRYAWRIANVRRLPNPVPVTGHQGFFFWKEGKQVCKEQGL